MDTERLFLRRCEQIALAAASEDEGELIDLSGRLYQMISDRHCLADVVNTGRRKLRFRVVKPAPLPEFLEQYRDAGLMWMNDDSLDPELFEPHQLTNMDVVEITKDEFLALPILTLERRDLTIKEVIGYARNVAGGTHIDPKELYGSYEVLQQFRNR